MTKDASTDWPLIELGATVRSRPVRVTDGQVERRARLCGQDAAGRSSGYGVGMSDEHHAAMRRAVDLAQTGRFNNWWVIQAQLHITGYREGALNWSERQREWLDRVCAEARVTRLAERGGAPAT